MANLNIPPPNPNSRPSNTYQWLGLLQKVIGELKGISWEAPDTMNVNQIINSIGNDLNFKQTMHNTIKDAFTIAYTPNKILEKLKTVDGINSGLDTDFVRGYVPVNKEGDSMSGFLTLHADPVQALHAATKQYVDSSIEGFIIKLPAKVATTENIELTGLKEIDGIPVVVDDRVLVKDQTDKKQNGIYVVQAEEWIRSKDADSSNELKPGSHIFVNEGNINKDSSWVFISDNVEVGVSDIEFSQFSGTGQITPGTGLAKNGNTLYLTDTGVKKGTFTKVNVDLQGRITFGDTLIASDIPNLDWSKITTGKPTTVQGYGITNAVRTDTDNNINGNLSLIKENGVFKIESSASIMRIITNHDGFVYIQAGINSDNLEGNMHLTGYSARQLNSFKISVRDANATINNNRILTTKDVGVGAGLNADLLDGLHATSFMRTDTDTSTSGFVDINKSPTNTRSALSVTNPSTGDSLISLLRTGSGLRSWRFGVRSGDFIFESKTDTETVFVPHVSINTTDKQIYVGSNVVWNKGNDGANSGLDADLLDGQQGSFYQNANNINVGTIANGRLSSSVYVGDNSTWATNEETTFNYKRSGFKRLSASRALIHYANPANGGVNSTGIELSNTDGNDNTLNFYKLNGSGSDVFRHKIWHSGRQGHGTGMDADTIDGKHLTDLTNLFVNATGDTMTGFLKLHADPTDPLHAATKQYVDGVVQGLDFKQSVKCATTTNLAKLEGLLTVDSVVLRQMDRVLVKNQTDKKQNGIYVANTGAWVRSSDANHINKLNIGAYIFVDGGVVNKASGWVVDNITTGDIGLAEISFVQFSGTGQMIAGQGIGINGNEIYITNTGVTSGTYTKVNVNAQGRITQGTSLVASDIPNLDWSKITTGKPTTVQGYGITNTVRTDANSTVNAGLYVTDGNLKLKANVNDHAFLEFYKKRNVSSRSGVIGYGSSSDVLLLTNEIGNTDIGNTKYNTLIRGNTHFTNIVKIENGLPKLLLKKNSQVSPNTRTEILFECVENQHMKIMHSFLDTECPVDSGNGLTIEGYGNSTQNTFLQVKGEFYGGVDGTKKVYHTGNFNPGSYLPLTGGTLTGKLNINHNDGMSIQSRLVLTTQNADYCKVGASDGDCYTLYNKNGIINLYSGKNTSNGLTFNGKKVWHENNDGAGSGLDADLLDGANSSVAPTANTIPKRGTDGSIESNISKTNKVVLGNKAQIVYNETEKSIDFVIL